MRLASRTARRFDTFDRRFDKTVAAVLLSSGLVETQPYVFTQTDEGGQSVVYFDIEAQSFIVFMSYRPKYMDEIDDLYADSRLPKAPTVGAFSYLTPTCMTHRPKLFPCKIAARRDHSFDLVRRGLESHALKWLISLRDPAIFADNTPPTAMMYVGRSNEIAGRLNEALLAYNEQMRRCLECINSFTFQTFVESEAARAFVYLCLKLNRELNKAEKVAAAIKYRPKVAPLGSDHFRSPFTSPPASAPAKTPADQTDPSPR